MGLVVFELLFVLFVLNIGDVVIDEEGVFGEIGLEEELLLFL